MTSCSSTTHCPRAGMRVVLFLFLFGLVSLGGESLENASAGQSTSYKLAVSSQADRSNPQPLDGATYDRTSTVYVFVQPNKGIRRVSFYLDDPARNGPPRTVDSVAPYDFNLTAADGTAQPFPLDSLSPGSHTITAAVERAQGRTEVVTSTFTVRSSAYKLAVSAQRDRSNPQPLDGATYARSSSIYVFVQPPEGVLRVSFYLDDPARNGPPRTVESVAPYDFNLTAADGTAQPFPLDSLSPGSHTITAAVETALGQAEVVTSTFTVAGDPSTPLPLVFQDDFVGTSLDTASYYQYDGPGHGGHGLRRPSALKVENGMLVVTAQMVDGQIVSGGLANRHDLTYGRFEFRVRTEQDPAGVMSGVVLTWPRSGNWPTDGELDIYETGNLTNTRWPFASFIHYGAANNRYAYYHQADAAEWHTMAMEWSPTAIKISRDGAPVWTVTDAAAIPDVAHHLCIQLDAILGGKALTSPVRMYVDYVRVYGSG